MPRDKSNQYLVLVDLHSVLMRRLHQLYYARQSLHAFFSWRKRNKIDRAISACVRELDNIQYDLKTIWSER